MPLIPRGPQAPAVTSHLILIQYLCGVLVLPRGRHLQRAPVAVLPTWSPLAHGDPCPHGKPCPPVVAPTPTVLPSVTPRPIAFDLISPDLILSPLPQGSPGKDGIPGVRGDKGDIGFMGPRGLKVGRGRGLFPGQEVRGRVRHLGLKVSRLRSDVGVPRADCEVLGQRLEGERSECLRPVRRAVSGSGGYRAGYLEVTFSSYFFLSGRTGN